MGALRAFYGAAYSALGAILPIFALALESRGFTPTQYALLIALQPAMRVVGPPLWGVLADRVLGTGHLLRINAWIAALSMAVLATSASRPVTLVAVVAWAVVSASVFALADAGTHALLGERAASFGRVRVFGSVGFVFSALGVAWIGVEDAYRLPFAVASAAYALTGWFARVFPTAAPFRRPGLRRAVRAHTRRREVRLLLWGVATYYAGHGIYDAYLGLHVVHATGMDPAQVSLLWAFGVLVEIPVVALAPRWLKARAAPQLLAFAALIAAARWALLSQVTTPLQVWLLQPLHGVTFGLWYLAYVYENQRLAPEALRATAQGLGAAALGAGMVAGTLLGGQLLEHAPEGSEFWLASAAALVACVLYARLGRVASIELPQRAG